MLRFKGRFLCLMLTVFVLLTGCSHSESADLTMQFDKEGNYTGFSNISDLSKYKSVTALRDGCYVCKDNSYSGGRQSWTALLDNTALEQSGACRFIQFYEDDTLPSLIDIYYQNGEYHVFFSDRSNPAGTGYVYTDRKVLSGIPSGLSSAVTCDVLTTNPDLTFEDLAPVLNGEDLSEETSASFCIVLIDDMMFGWTYGQAQ